MSSTSARHGRAPGFLTLNRLLLLCPLLLSETIRCAVVTSTSTSRTADLMRAPQDHRLTLAPSGTPQWLPQELLSTQELCQEPRGRSKNPDPFPTFCAAARWLRHNGPRGSKC